MSFINMDNENNENNENNHFNVNDSISDSDNTIELPDNTEEIRVSKRLSDRRKGIMPPKKIVPLYTCYLCHDNKTKRICLGCANYTCVSCLIDNFCTQCSDEKPRRNYFPIITIRKFYSKRISENKKSRWWCCF